jgi:hypothetical protein
MDDYGGNPWGGGQEQAGVNPWGQPQQPMMGGTLW